MAVLYSQTNMNSIANLLPQLHKDFPDITFIPGDSFFWSPKERKITYTTHQDIAEHGVWALLHELSHATLGHEHYDTDYELIKLELTAWQHARRIGKKYNVSIDGEHIQDCLDTYRDWLHKRATCPNCNVVSLQRSDNLYQCFNCKTTWSVPRSPLCRVTRRVITT